MLIFTFLLYYIVFINTISVLLCIIDKIKAKNGGWRISEKSLFAASVLGGSVAMYFTMLAVRHKTKHKRFMIGLPAIIIFQCVLILWFIRLTSA